MALHHPVFQGPFPVSLDRTSIPTPANYGHYHQEQPLGETLDGWMVQDAVRDADGKRLFGSVAVNWGFDDTPDGEIISSGVNSKGPYWVAIGRHGNYLMWGFAAGPDALTPSGKAVFLNSVVYIAGFDRQPPRSRRNFIGRGWWLDQAVQFRDLAKEYERLKKLEAEQGRPLPASFALSSFEAFTERSATRSFPDLWPELGPDLDAYYPAVLANRDYLFATGREFAPARIDRDAKAYGIPNHSPKLLEHCIQLLEQGEDLQRAQRVLERYTGLTLRSAATWRQWYDEVKAGLYFSDTAGYRFFPLVPSRFEREQAATAVAVDAATPDAPVQIVGMLQRDPGSSTRGTVLIRMQTAPGWHLYADAGADSPYHVTRLTLADAQGLGAIGEWLVPPSHPSGADPTLRTWEGDLVFQHRIEAQPGTVLPSEIAVRVAYQVCDANMCQPPMEVNVTCRVAGAGTGAGTGR